MDDREIIKLRGKALDEAFREYRERKIAWREWKGNDKARKALSDASDALKFAIESLNNESIASSFVGEEIRVLILFSGIGAFEAALKRIRVPFSLVGYCEIDRFASKSYSAIHGVPESMNLWDVRKVDGKSMDGKVDLLTYGFPCQDISSAGKMAGFEKDGETTRSGLFFEALRIIQECKPRIAIAENVKNLTSKRFEKEFATVLRSLEEAGYRNYWKVLNARDYGIPQNRERIFIVSVRNDVEEGKPFEFPEKEELELRLKDMLESEVDEKYYLSDRMVKYLSASNEKWTGNNKHSFINKTLASAINTKEGSRRCDASNYISKCLQENADLKCIQVGQMYGEGNPQAQPITQQNLRVRRLTPKECWRLMGFSDEDFEKAKSAGISDSQLYKQAGNSIVVNVVEAILRELIGQGFFGRR